MKELGLKFFVWFQSKEYAVFPSCFSDDSELENNSESRDRLINAWERAATLNLTNCERRPPV